MKGKAVDSVFLMAKIVANFTWVLAIGMTSQMSTQRTTGNWQTAGGKLFPGKLKGDAGLFCKVILGEAFKDELLTVKTM